MNILTLILTLMKKKFLKDLLKNTVRRGFPLIKTLGEIKDKVLGNPIVVNGKPAPMTTWKELLVKFLFETVVVYIGIWFLAFIMQKFSLTLEDIEFLKNLFK
jgi:hypothetical protein